MLVALLAGLVAFAISGSAVWSQHPPLDRPNGQFELQEAMVGGGPITQSVEMEPYEVLKYKHIVRQAYDYSCGSAALVTIMNFDLGVTVNEQVAMEGMMQHGEKEKIIARRGFSLLDMKRYLTSIGIESAGFRGEVSDLQTLDHPALVPIDFGGSKHFVVVRGIRNGVVYIADPSAGNLVFSQSKFASLWDRNTFFVVYPPKDKLALHQLALSDQELGVTDMDRIKDRAILAPLNQNLQMERLINGYGGVSIHKQ
ncbi:putative double-glycine peptidase [Oxalobacteraceae bacterium GrIS 1.18]